MGDIDDEEHPTPRLSVLFVSSSIPGKESNSNDTIKALDGIWPSQQQFLLLFNACARQPGTQSK